MKKTIKTPSSMGFKAASKGDQAFADMHPIQVIDAHDEKVSKALDDIAKAKAVIPYERTTNRHGYNKGEDEAAYDSFKHNAGGPVVAPVYTKPMHEGFIRSCPICQGNACDHCDNTGFAVTSEEHSNAIVRHLRREVLGEMDTSMTGLVKAFDKKKADWKQEADDVRAFKDKVFNSKSVKVAGAVVRGAEKVVKTMARGAGNFAQGLKDIKRAGELHKEETEQLDELSKDTLGSYIKGALKDKHEHERSAEVHAYSGQRHHHIKKANQRKAGVEKAVDKLTKEEAEQLDEFSLAVAHNAAQDRIRAAVAAAPGRAKSLAKSALSNLKDKVVSTYHTAQDRYEGGPQRRAEALKARKEAQFKRISSKADGYESRAQQLSQYASHHLLNAEKARSEADRTVVPKYNLHQVTTTDDYERKKNEIANTEQRKKTLSAQADQHKSLGLQTADAADAAATRSARIRDRLDKVKMGQGIRFGRQAKPESSLKKYSREKRNPHVIISPREET